MTVKIVWKKPDKGIVPKGNEIQQKEVSEERCEL